MGLWDNEPLQSNKWLFSNNTVTYLNTLDSLILEIESVKSSFQGLKLILNHPAFFYLFQESLLNISRLATIEKGEEQEPSAVEIANIIALMKQENCHLIVTDPQHKTENVYEIARETNSKIALLTALLNVDVEWDGNAVNINNYTQMIEYDIWALAHPLDPPPLIDLWLTILIIGMAIAIIFIIGIILRRRK
jgi:ABC-type Zn uptake system ZnuABC Zn-binding protein ZnuA